jgi:IMP cyclohydrolase
LKELTAVRQTRDQLYASKDIAGLSKFHAQNLTAELADGSRLDRAGYEALLQKQMESGAPAPSHLTRLLQEEAAYVAVVEGQDVVVRETWKKTGDGWKLKSVQDVSEGSAIASKKGDKKRVS